MKNLLTSNQAAALRKISLRLSAENIPYVVIGGLAAIAWGSRRVLADIDIQVSKSDIKKVRNIFKGYIHTDLRHYQTENWDIVQMIIDINGVVVDICQAEDFICHKGTKKYVLPSSIHDTVMFNFEDLSIPVLPKKLLIEYKRFLARPVDQQDLDAIK